MDKGLLKKAAAQSVALMLAVITMSFGLNQYRTVVISASDIEKEDMTLVTVPTEDTEAASQEVQNEAAEDEPEAVVAEPEEEPIMPGIDMELVKSLGERFLAIRKPVGDKLTVTLQDLYVTKTLSIIIEGTKVDAIDAGMVGRVNNGQLFLGNPIYTEVESIIEASEEEPAKTVVEKDYGNDLAYNITITRQADEALNKESLQISIELDDVYAHVLHEDEAFYYIELANPHEVYERILVIDAGHGGKDAGAIASDNKTYEKEINLNILLALKELLDQEGIKVYYTRLTDETRFLRPRVELANAVDSDFFISIHCNASEASSPNGSEILYYDTEKKKIRNKELADILSEELAKTVSLKKRGLIKMNFDDIFILEHSEVPTALIEVGYMTNKNDISYLRKPENIEAVARGIYNGIKKAYEVLIK